jgi:hypothetical protein
MKMLRDLENPRAMYLKAALLLTAGLSSLLLIIGRLPTLETGFLLIVTIWSFCRLYYFAFYVVEKYVDPGYRFSGLLSFAAYLISRNRRARGD